MKNSSPLHPLASTPATSSHLYTCSPAHLYISLLTTTIIPQRWSYVATSSSFTSALGDFIITWPLAMSLSRLYPQSRILYITHGQKGELAEAVLRVESATSRRDGITCSAPNRGCPKADEAIGRGTSRVQLHRQGR